MRAEFFISARYLLTKRKEKFISLISVISVMGVAIGVAALIVVIAVMTGFDNDLREKIIGNHSHITIYGFEGIDEQMYAGIAAKVKDNTHIIGASAYVQGQVLVKDINRFFALGIKGIDPVSERQVTNIGRYLIAGNLEDLSGPTVIIGSELAKYLGLELNSLFTVYSPQEMTQELKVAGIFRSGMYDYDMNLVFVNRALAQEFLGLGDKFTAVALKLDNAFRADKVKEELAGALGYNYTLKTWMEVNENFFSALQLEKITMFIILTLIILVASFNIISTLIVMVVEKTKDIGVLRALGMSSSSIRRIFTCEGLLIGGAGTFLGAAGGMLLCFLLKKYQFISLPQDIYYIDRLPVSIELWPDIALIILAAFGITLISTIYPAHKAAGLEPVEALRYE